jgi:hypothetical protein
MNRNYELIINTIKPPKTSGHDLSWNKRYVGMVYKDLKPVHQLVKHSKNATNISNGEIIHDNFIVKTSHIPINKFDVPLSLKDVIRLYFNDGESIGLTPKQFLFTENFAYLLALMHFKNIKTQILEFRNEIEILPGVFIYNKQTENAMKVKRYAKELAMAEDCAYNEIDKRKNIVVASNKRRQLKEAISRWFADMNKYDKLGNINRKNKILKK